MADPNRYPPADPPDPTDPAPRQIGRSGRGHTDGFIVADERNQKLIGAPGLETFDKMWRTDPDVRKALTMVYSPMVAATWDIEAYGGEDAEQWAIDDAELCKWALFTQMRPRWKSHVGQIIRVAGRSGFAPFEQLWKSGPYKGRTVLFPRTLDVRLPRTIQRWNQDGPDLVSIEQYTFEQSGEVTIPAENLVYYRFGEEGDNWTGDPLIRAAYKPWKYKEILEVILSIAMERYAIGVPVGYPPQGAETGDQIESLIQALAGMRANEQGFIVMPGPNAQYSEKGQGWLVEIMTPQGGGEHLNVLHEALRYMRDEIAASVIEEFMRLGQGKVGARATASVQQDPFLAFCEAIVATVIEEPADEQLLKKIVQLNQGEREGYPQISASVLDSTTLTDLAVYIQSLSAAGALTLDNELEDYLRRRADLPPVDPDARDSADLEKRAQIKQAIRNAETPGGPTDAGAGGTDDQGTLPARIDTPRESAAQDGQARRQLMVESRRLPFHDHMPLAAMESVLDGAREAFERAGVHAVHGLAKQLATGPGDAVPDAPEDLRGVLAGQLHSIYTTGYASVEHERRSQREGVLQDSAGALLQPVAMMLAAGPEPPGSLRLRGDLSATAIVSAIWHAIHQAILARRQPGSVQQAGEDAGRAALRSEALAQSSYALNTGREAAAEVHADEIRGTLYTSVLDDNNRCAPCGHADDGVIRSLDDPVRLARKPPNPDCNGGGRCRCMEFYVFKEEAPTAASEEAQAARLLEGAEGPRVGTVLLEQAQADGVMVALFPSKAAAGRLALPYPDAEPADELHVTLAFLGRTGDVSDPERLRQAVRGWAQGTPPIEGKVAGLGVFTGGDKPVTYLSVDVPDLPRHRERLIGALDNAGIGHSTEHGFTPHMTVAYADCRQHQPSPTGLQFSHVAVVHGEDRTDIPLTGDGTVVDPGTLGWPKPKSLDDDRPVEVHVDVHPPPPAEVTVNVEPPPPAEVHVDKGAVQVRLDQPTPTKPRPRRVERDEKGNIERIVDE